MSMKRALRQACASSERSRRADVASMLTSPMLRPTRPRFAKASSCLSFSERLRTMSPTAMEARMRMTWCSSSATMAAVLAAATRGRLGTSHIAAPAEADIYGATRLSTV